jgi:hypothetical protein
MCVSACARASRADISACCAVPVGPLCECFSACACCACPPSLEDVPVLFPCWGLQALGAGRRAWRWHRWHALAAEVTDEGSDDHRLPLAVAQGGVKRRSAQAKERGEQVHREGESAGVICSGEVSHAREDLQDALAHVEAVGAVSRLSPS